jgi:3-oxoacyl-[acyl-carrier protein] reductase
LTTGTAVTVNAVMAGSARTDGVAALVRDLFPDLPFAEAEARFMREYRPASLIQRLIDPSEVGDFVTYVASPRASVVNGAALRIEGGLVPRIV